MNALAQRRFLQLSQKLLLAPCNRQASLANQRLLNQMSLVSLYHNQVRFFSADNKHDHDHDHEDEGHDDFKPKQKATYDEVQLNN